MPDIAFALNVALILIVIGGLFIAGWRWLPSGWLTATTGAAGGLVMATDIALQTISWTDLRGVVPDEHEGWVMLVILGLTILARFRGVMAAPAAEEAE